MADHLDPEVQEILAARRLDPAELAAGEWTVPPPVSERERRARWRDRRGRWVTPGSPGAVEQPVGVGVRQPRSAPY